MKSAIKYGLVLFSVMMALAMGVAFAENETAAVEENNTTLENVTAENVTAENVTAVNVTAENVTAENETAENVTAPVA